jgi:uncharacterized protein YecT (DUF1311 family)
MSKVPVALAVLCIAEGLLSVSAPAQAQSFDCRKATTAVEHLVCTDKALTELDSPLASELNSAITAYPEQRKELISEERRWIADRDERCVMKTSGSIEVMPNCERAQDRQRIADLKASVVKREADVIDAAVAASCRTVVDRYRALASANLGKSPLTALAGSPTSGITVAKALGRAPGDLAAWSAMQDPPFKVGEDLRDAWSQERSFGVWELNRLPGTDLYSISAVAGTAQCIYAVFFEVEKGLAQLVGAPPGFEAGRGASCGVRRSFGRIDNDPALFQELYDSTPKMSSTLTIATWKGGHFVPGCTVAFSYAPAFGGETLNLHQESCTASDCEGLRRAAFQLAEAVQKSPHSARAELLASLSPEQRTEYDNAERIAGARQSAAEADPANVTEQNPLRMPYPSAGQLYVASVGHFTIGWRYFSDWSINFDAPENGKLVRRAAFAVAMKRGELADVTVVPISSQGAR